MHENKGGFPWYFAIEDGASATKVRLVQVVATADGGMDVLVFNPETKTLEQDLAYLARCFAPGQNVERLTEAEFHRRAQTGNPSSKPANEPP